MSLFPERHFTARRHRDRLPVIGGRDEKNTSKTNARTTVIQSEERRVLSKEFLHNHSPVRNRIRIYTRYRESCYGSARVVMSFPCKSRDISSCPEGSCRPLENFSPVDPTSSRRMQLIRTEQRNTANKMREIKALRARKLNKASVLFLSREGNEKHVSANLQYQPMHSYHEP